MCPKFIPVIVTPVLYLSCNTLVRLPREIASKYDQRSASYRELFSYPEIQALKNRQRSRSNIIDIHY